MHRGLPGINTTLVFVSRRSLDDHPLSWHLFRLSIFRFIIRITLRLIQFLSFTSRDQLAYLMGCTMHMYECQDEYRKIILRFYTVKNQTLNGKASRHFISKR
jgi:hypothetical protein